MNLRRNTHRTTRVGLHWSRVNAGSRAQVELPVTNTRYFRVAGTSVKSAEVAFPVAHALRPMTSRVVPVLPFAQRRLVLRGDRDFLRALRAAEMAEWEASGGDFTQSATETQPAGGGFAGSKVTLAAAAAGNPSYDLPF